MHHYTAKLRARARTPPVISVTSFGIKLIKTMHKLTFFLTVHRLHNTLRVCDTGMILCTATTQMIVLQGNRFSAMSAQKLDFSAQN
jgi:hypothetical protein